MDTKKVLKVRSVFFVGGSDLVPEVRMRTRRIRLLDIIQEVTDISELPEYLSDEDSNVIDAAKLKLKELTGSDYDDEC